MQEITSIESMHELESFDQRNNQESMKKTTLTLDPGMSSNILQVGNWFEFDIVRN